ncbi:MAG: thioredoxin-disulfide reductase [Eubacteriaceae bacterium]
MHEYDTIIIGGGPAGLSAALYASRANLNTLLLELGTLGGQISSTSEVENYPGSIRECTGPLLVERMKEQCIDFGTDIKIERFTSFKKQDKYFVVSTEKDSYKSKTIIIATGAYPKVIGCKGEKEFIGLGVSYCATCDANFFRGLKVMVVGGGDSAVDEGIYLTKFVEKVTIVHRRSELRAAKSLQKKAFSNPKIDFIWDSTIEEVKGNGIVRSVMIRNLKTEAVKEVPVDGVFVFIGYHPNTENFKDVIEMDNRGNILSDEDMNTNIPGVFVAGDVRKKTLKQVVTAAADGAVAAVNAEKYIAKIFG